jgi:hypothetical protein
MDFISIGKSTREHAKKRKNQSAKIGKTSFAVYLASFGRSLLIPIL